MSDQLEKLQVDLVGYREAVDQIFSSDLTTAKSWRACFSEVLVCTAQLYLDYRLVMKIMPELELLVSQSGNGGEAQSRSAWEVKLRTELQRRLESSNAWPGFVPQNSFSNLTGLRTLRDYTDSLALHLPEIYEETFRIEACAKTFLSTHSGTALAQILVGLQHLGRNHVSFVLQPLEWIADDGSWGESPLADRPPLRFL